MILCLGGDMMIEEEKRWGLRRRYWSAASHKLTTLKYYANLHPSSRFLMRSISKKNCSSKAIHKKHFKLLTVKKMANIFEWNLIFILLTSKIVRTHNTKATKLNKIASINYFFFLAIFEMPCTKMKHLWKKKLESQ